MLISAVSSAGGGVTDAGVVSDVTAGAGCDCAVCAVDVAGVVEATCARSRKKRTNIHPPTISPATTASRISGVQFRRAAVAMTGRVASDGAAGADGVSGWMRAPQFRQNASPGLTGALHFGHVTAVGPSLQFFKIADAQ